MASKKKRRGKPPAGSAGTVKKKPIPHDDGHLLLSFRHIHKGWGVEELEDKQRSDFLLKWAKRCGFTWKELQQHGRHGLGYEMLPAHSIYPRAPEHLAEDRYMVFRYHGNLPFAGFKAGDTFYVLWIERQYGDLYNHG